MKMTLFALARQLLIDFLAVSKTLIHLLERRLANALMFIRIYLFIYLLILNVSSVSDGGLDPIYYAFLNTIYSFHYSR